MNYRHIYHAGNFADVFKHWILTLILDKLSLKPSPFCLLDMHGGLGVYNLNHTHAQKTLEYKSGIEQLLSKQLAPEFQSYIDIVRRFAEQENLYPGSVAIMQAYLRENDRLFIAELHPEDYKILCENFNNDKRIKIFNQDSYATLKSLLPPKERRGLILIDPPFEQVDEFTRIVTALMEAIKRFATGMYIIWYPIKDRKIVEKFYKEININVLQPKLYIEIHANEQVLNQLNSCGMLIINPPWKLAELLRANMPELLKYLNFSHGTYLLVNK